MGEDSTAIDIRVAESTSAKLSKSFVTSVPALISCNPAEE